MHELDIFHEHLAMSDEERGAIAQYIWNQENIELSTIGIDIGSSTSHLLFAKVLLQRQSQGLSSRFAVVHRQVVWRSPIMLRNAQAIDELFAAEAGKFVCATAGHKLESMLAAHGSGAVRLSRERGACILHVDIGGGTTKLALIDKGVFVGVAAFAVGGRLIAADAAGGFTRVDDSARLVADALGIGTDAATLANPDARHAIARRLAMIASDYIVGAPPDALGEALL